MCSNVLDILEHEHLYYMFVVANYEFMYEYVCICLMFHQLSSYTRYYHEPMTHDYTPALLPTLVGKPAAHWTHWIRPVLVDEILPQAVHQIAQSHQSHHVSAVLVLPAWVRQGIGKSLVSDGKLIIISIWLSYLIEQSNHLISNTIYLPYIYDPWDKHQDNKHNESQ